MYETQETEKNRWKSQKSVSSFKETFFVVGVFDVCSLGFEVKEVHRHI